jgi:hypothetical protein
MKRSKFTEAHISFVLRQGGDGTAIGEALGKAESERTVLVA